MTMTVDRLMGMNEGCDKPVGAGVIAYPCRLAPRHEHTEGSPCVAPEVPASVRRHNAWEKEVETKQRLREDFERTNGMPPPANEGEVESAAVRRTVQEHFDAMSDEEKEAVREKVEEWRARVEPTPEQELDADLRPVSPNPDLVPTKQRPGDQRLPSGGGACVQDRIIADMTESKRVGIERYGQVLRTFNGRKGFQDVFEEVRDLHVYMTMIAMEAEASGDDLVGVVESMLDEWDSCISAMTAREVAEQIIDRLGGWLLANRLGGVE